MNLPQPIQLSGVLPAGVYRHYKGPLYLVLGLAHDANADTLFDAREELQFPDGRKVVVYVSLQLDAAHEGPRLAVRTLEDFNAIVCVRKKCLYNGQDITEGSPRECINSGHGYSRFTYLGSEYIAGMEL